MTHAQHQAKWGGKPLAHMCDCTKPATHKVGTFWECDDCRKKNAFATKLLLEANYEHRTLKNANNE